VAVPDGLHAMLSTTRAGMNPASNAVRTNLLLFIFRPPSIEWWILGVFSGILRFCL
jgi:hypothetical protein